MSRSEQLLRSTLMRLDVGPPSPLQRPGHKRRHSHAPSPSHLDDDTRKVYGGDAECDPSLGSPWSITGRSARAHSPASSKHSSSPRYAHPPPQIPPATTPSPKSRKRQSLPASLPMTPPERALRHRLERALNADRQHAVPDYAYSRDRKTSNEVRDESGGWPWREHDGESVRVLPPHLMCLTSLQSSSSHPTLSPLTLPPTRPRSASKPRTPIPAPRSANSLPAPTSTPIAPPIQPKHEYPAPGKMPTPPPTPPGRARARTESPYSPRRTEPISLTLTHTQKSPSVYLTRRDSTRSTRAHARRSPSASPSMSTHSTSQTTHSDESIPPLVLPPLSSFHPPSTSSPSPHAHPHPGKFNARRASERLRTTSGYVSFASVEGLGGPPETPVNEDAAGAGAFDEEAERGRKGRGLGRVVGWVWGAVGVGA
ncbi:hypothetical protein H0H87_012701 [Tephrocybe sp. NHM501043]|nr:hypothetical protein H0H87_012701 [Tephrocybe sp. NHM501043]